MGVNGMATIHVGTMQPSIRGVHKVSKRHVGSTTHHWKRRILEFKQGSDGKQLAKVQHVYMASQLNITNSKRVLVNCEFILDLQINFECIQ